MFAANTYLIRPATDQDARSLSRLAELDSQAPLASPAVIGQVAGTTVAAMSLADGRIIADPLRCTANLKACLRVRANALRAYNGTPARRVRMLAGLPAQYVAGSGARPDRPSRHRTAKNTRQGADRRKRQRSTRQSSLAVSD